MLSLSSLTELEKSEQNLERLSFGYVVDKKKGNTPRA